LLHQSLISPPLSTVTGELGIVFFLFEMGLELSIARLNAMKKDVFGLGTMQFLLTSAAGSLFLIGSQGV
jgi:Kef-type K+ transport system membrane component KefB